MKIIYARSDAVSFHNVSLPNVSLYKNDLEGDTMFTQKALVAETIKLQRFALKLTRNKADADDLSQSTYLRAIEKADYFQDGTNLYAWTSKIMFNIFVTGYRRRARFETQYDPEPYLAAQVTAPEQEDRMNVLEVKKAIKNLSDEHRQIIALVCVKGMQYSEVSEMLQIPVGTVRSRLSRAREQLRIIMDSPNLPLGYIKNNTLAAIH